MNATELISKLQFLVDLHGDATVTVYDETEDMQEALSVELRNESFQTDGGWKYQNSYHIK